ncbi:hypothetical protein ID866_8448 [Astraeus odoratus]|nr:hypothetical protein ID866_8448 [Astraeus odoratus]
MFGGQLRSLHLSNLNIPSRRLHNILRACPNLRSARITQNLTCYGEEVESFPVVVVMPHLRSLRLRGSRAMQFLLENVRTPTLSRLDVEWDQRNDCVTLFPYLEAFLSQSPSVEELILRDVIPTEDALIRLITNNAHITRLVITMSWGPEYVITDRTFELLTFQEEYRVLPQLDKLVIHGGLDVKDELIAAMIASRSEPPLLSGSQAPTGTGLNHVLLSRRIPMASDVVAELERRYPGASISGGKRFLYQA